MINFKKRTYIFSCFLLSFYFSLLSADSDLNNILAPLSQLKSIHFSFTEYRSSVFFKKDHVSSGEITFVKPQHLIKEVFKPEYKSYEIQKEQLIIKSSLSTNEISIQSINLKNYQKLKNFIDLVIALFTGNSSFLYKNYHVSIAKKLPTANWLVKLKPISIINETMTSSSIAYIEIKGLKDQIISIYIKGYGGESSKLVIDKVIRSSYY